MATEARILRFDPGWRGPKARLHTDRVPYILLLFPVPRCPLFCCLASLHFFGSLQALRYS